MHGQNMHPSRLPALAIRRGQLAALKRQKPETFSAEQDAQLEELTDTLINALTFSMARLSDEVSHLRSRSRRGF